MSVIGHMPEIAAAQEKALLEAACPSLNGEFEYWGEYLGPKGKQRIGFNHAISRPGIDPESVAHVQLQQEVKDNVSVLKVSVTGAGELPKYVSPYGMTLFCQRGEWILPINRKGNSEDVAVDERGRYALWISDGYLIVSYRATVKFSSLLHQEEKRSDSIYRFGQVTP